jgi:hypothetical protein
MGMFEDIGKGNVSTVLVGLGVAMVAPTVLPALASGLRPLAKALVKGGVTLYDAAREGVAEAGEQLSDLLAETRAEMGVRRPVAHAAGVPVRKPTKARFQAPPFY